MSIYEVSWTLYAYPNYEIYDIRLKLFIYFWTISVRQNNWMNNILWKWFIDDILVIFNGTYEEIEDFYKFAESFHDTIKFDKSSYSIDRSSWIHVRLIDLGKELGSYISRVIL